MRLFLGIAPDDNARAALRLLAERLRPRIHGQYADPALYHLTLAFLGETPADQVERIKAVMRLATVGTGSFTLTLDAIGAFQRVLWCGVRQQDALSALAANIRDALRLEDIAYDEKPFRPHFTLARNAMPADVSDAMELSNSSLHAYAQYLYRVHSGWPQVSFQVDSILLYHSDRRAGRLTYTPIWRVALS